MKQFVLAVFTIIFSVATLGGEQAQGGSVPSLINYQGMLTDAAGQPMETKEYKLSFSIYTGSTGGTAVWGPQVFNSVPVVRGHFNVMLGPKDTSGKEISTAFTSENAYLEIKVGSDTITPRQRILSVPYAMNAANATNAINATNATNATTAANGVPPGTIVAFGGSTPPSGWLLCDGEDYSQTGQYADLYKAIGKAWGGTSSRFNVPDLRGRFLRGVAHGSSRDPDRGSRSRSASGGNTGDKVGSVQEYATALPKSSFKIDKAGEHSHKFNHSLGESNGSNSLNMNNGSNGLKDGIITSAGEHTHSVTGGDNETRPTNAYVEYIIKY